MSIEQEDQYHADTPAYEKRTADAPRNAALPGLRSRGECFASLPVSPQLMTMPSLKVLEKGT